MFIGALRNRVEIQHRVETGRSAVNEPIYEWVRWRRPYCIIAARRAAEKFDEETSERFSSTSYTMTFRYNEVSGLTPDMRILLEGKFYNVKAPITDLAQRDFISVDAEIQSEPAGRKPVSIDLPGLPDPGEAGVPYSGFSLMGAGGEEPYEFSIVSGALPPGIELDGATGQVSGTPTLAGTYPNILFGVQDSDGIAAYLAPLDLEIT